MVCLFDYRDNMAKTTENKSFTRSNDNVSIRYVYHICIVAGAAEGVTRKSPSLFRLILNSKTCFYPTLKIPVSHAMLFNLQPGAKKKWQIYVFFPNDMSANVKATE